MSDIRKIRVPQPKFTSDGKEITPWKTVGDMICTNYDLPDDAKIFLKLHMFPETTFNVYKFDDQAEKPKW